MAASGEIYMATVRHARHPGELFDRLAAYEMLASTQPTAPLTDTTLLCHPLIAHYDKARQHPGRLRRPIQGASVLNRRRSVSFHPAPTRASKTRPARPPPPPEDTNRAATPRKYAKSP
jgi:hypothetical protein